MTGMYENQNGNGNGNHNGNGNRPDVTPDELRLETGLGRFVREPTVEGRRVLVTGACGFIGSHLVEALVEGGAEVRAMVRYNARGDRGALEWIDPAVLSEIDIHAGDIRSRESVGHAVDGRDLVFHLASQIAVPHSYIDPRTFIETNTIGALNVAQACRENEVERMVHTSSSETYGTAQHVPITEDHPVAAQSPYAASKIGADQLVLSFTRSLDLRATVVRPFNTYGPRQSARSVIPTIISQALIGDVIKLGSLGPRRDFTYVTDTVRGFIHLGTERPHPGRGNPARHGAGHLDPGAGRGACRRDVTSARRRDRREQGPPGQRRGPAPCLERRARPEADRLGAAGAAAGRAVRNRPLGRGAPRPLPRRRARHLIVVRALCTHRVGAARPGAQQNLRSPAWLIVVALVGLLLSASAAPAAATTTVSLSFDDGYEDNMAAKQILADHGLNGTFFISTGLVGEPGYMNWDQISSLYADGTRLATTPSRTRTWTTSPRTKREARSATRARTCSEGLPAAQLRLPLRTPRCNQRTARRGVRLCLGAQNRRHHWERDSGGTNPAPEPLGGAHPWRRWRR